MGEHIMFIRHHVHTECVGHGQRMFWMSRVVNSALPENKPSADLSRHSGAPLKVSAHYKVQKLAGVLALMISASSAPIFLNRCGNVVGK